MVSHVLDSSSPGIGAQDLDLIHNRVKQLSQRVHVQAERANSEWDALRAELDSVLERIREAQQEALCLTDEVERKNLQLKLLECQQALRIGPGGDICSYLQRKKRALILSLFLGNQIPLKAGYRQEALKIKQEYHNFRSRIAQLMLLFSSTLVFAMWHAADVAAAAEHSSQVTTTFDIMRGMLRHSFSPIIMVSVQAFCTFMIYVYVTMAAREGVLLLNGSSIRPWWIWHHYISAVTCMLFLILPVDSPAVQRYVEGWLHWTVAQAALMLMQNRYQQRRMYTRIALGKSSAMDVVGGESSGMPGQLIVLLPFLFGLQIWQVFMGANMVLQTGHAILEPEGWLEMERHETDLRGLRGMFFVGCLMAFMGVMNAFNTVQTIVAKQKAVRRFQARRRAARTQ